MFYSQFILAKKGPLGTIWIAAHLERKLRKNQVADTDIGFSVDSILSPDVPIALRLSSHLLLGVVRIYNRKVNYLFDDCSEALLKVKQAFRSAAVDLPPEESKAPYHSITLPETFDLDDFELPDNDIFQGNFVDHHISSREQITLQDTMEGVSYSTSKFGLDERFGDGDAPGLDLDEELFLDKIGTAGVVSESADPQASVGSMASLKQDEHPETRAVNSGITVDDVDGDADLMDYAQAPCTPGLVEEPNLSNVQEVSACDDHLESENHLVEFTMTGNAQNNPIEEKQEVDWCSHDNTNSDANPMMLLEENGFVSDINLSKLYEGSPIESNTNHVSVKESSSGSKPTFDSFDQIKTLNIPFESVDKIIEASDVEDLHNDAANEGKNFAIPVNKPCEDSQAPYEIGLEKSACEISGPASTCQQIHEDASVKEQESLVIEVTASDHEKTCPEASDLTSKNQDGSFPKNHGIQTCQQPMDLGPLNIDVHEKVGPTETPFLRPCNSNLEQPDITTSEGGVSTDADVQSAVAALATSGREETLMLGKPCRVSDNSEQTLKENDIREHTPEEGLYAASSEPQGQVHNANSRDSMVENLNNSEEAELPAPEKLLSVPEGSVDVHSDMLVEGTPGEFKGIDEGDHWSKIVTGKKRTFTESTLTEQSLNSFESSRLVRFKRTVESVPDDDDLLSSILAGKSSVLKVKPTPRLSEVTSMKRTRSAPRTGASKRKVLMDDTMVLHGDTIRQQLTTTEDIRRVRKKAPCSRPEISMIEKQYLEDEIFLGAIFTGTSLELASLHSQMYDLNRIRVCKNDTSLDIVTEPRLPSENDENNASFETVAEPIFASHGDKNDSSLEIVAEPQLTSQNAENGENLDRENAQGSGGPNVAEQSEVGVPGEVLLDRDNEVVEPTETPLLSNDEMKEVNGISQEVNISQEQTKPTTDVEADTSQQELLLDAAGVETNQENDNEVKVDASAVLSDEKTSAPSVELDFAVMGVDNGQVISRDEVMEKDGNVNAGIETEPVVRDDVLSEVARDGATVELLPNAKLGEVEYNDQGEIFSVMMGEHAVDSLYPGQIGVPEDGLMNNGENPEQAYQRNVMDAESSGFDLHDRDELKFSAFGDDTEFLNVDDDELTEMADDHIPDDEEARFTENTGWSSRTRAVSKYLQTLFVREAESGQKSLSMDNLLNGKSRKEASRMFFEALVLKTRDYIHVEQRNTFDDITIKPRTRLMKSDF
ncbi:hypothetical protein BUALT_Bualt01G0111500 [Buddleja alternifolia]|uniref:Sister chromatid cohesion 1 protein 4 n=1 Tax=Buddleja alternifolia TaxID=168488 RepID=A0AAV6YET2_9LAMI|nr:hypothetical protein BUALT_Bualt01G0111500 [Buddleja alternifolia]